MEKFIHVYLDREFAEEDKADYERHLTSCEHCRHLARFEERFKQRLRTGLARPSLPLEQREALRARVIKALEEAPPLPAAGPWRRWAVRLLPAAAAAGIIVVLVLQPDGEPALRGAVTPATARGTGGMGIVRGMGIAAGVNAPDFQRSSAGFRVVPPRFSDGRTPLVNARMRRVAAHPGAELTYRRDGRPIQVLMTPPAAAPLRGATMRRIGNHPVYFTRRDGRTVAAFHHRGVGYTVSAPLPLPELDLLVRDLLRPRIRALAPRSSIVLPVSQ